MKSVLSIDVANGKSEVLLITKHVEVLIKPFKEKIIKYLINTNEILKATYKCYQGIINAIKEKDFNKFKLIVEHQNNNISDKMKQALKLYKENLKYIENSFKYNINNGIVEGTNNLIKCLKRIAFGYKKYDHFIARIFMIKGIIKG